MADQAVIGGAGGSLLPAVARRSEAVVIPLVALVAGFAIFAVFLMTQGKSPAEFLSYVWKGAYGSAFSWQNTLSRAAPLLLAALCVALPARLGLVVIGGEGAIVLGGVAVGALGPALAGMPGVVGLPLMAAAAMLVGAFWIGLAGFFEVTAVHGSANASLAAGYGYTGILIAFLARHNPLAIIPVAILLAGFDASSGLIQRRMGLPDATILVLQGFVFLAILISDTFYGRFKIFAPERWGR